MPFVALVAAVVSFIGRQRRARLVAHVVAAKSADALGNMPWREFETLVGESFRLQGFRVEENQTAGPDGGVDLVLRRGSEKFLVQCKQWRAYKVSVQVVRELYGVMAAQGAAGGYVVTSGRFTDEAVEFASGRNVHLIDGPKLNAMLQQASAVRQERPKAAAVMPPVRFHQVHPDNAPAVPLAPHVPANATSCPACRGAMIKRQARRGANAGNEFWGCCNYPSCKGTRPVT